MTADTENKDKRAKRAGFRLSAARLAAVQALYEMEITGAAIDGVLASFIENRWREVTLRDPDLKPEEGGKARLAKPDPEYLTKLTLGISSERQRIEETVQAVLTGDWTTERLDTLMRMLLFTAAFELIFETEVPKRVLLSEYTDLAHAFFEDKEASFVVGILSALAAAVRPE